MANRFNYIPNRVIDTNGIADGASLFFYAPGTTTKIFLYSDSSLATPIANPVVVAAGASVPPIYYAETSVRVKVVNDAGVTVSDDDPYTPLDAGNIGLTGGGSLDDFFADACFPDRFGVVDDPNFANAGSRIDQSAALQAWFDYAATNRLSPTCYKPIRAYSSATLTYNPSALVSFQKQPDIRLSNLDLISAGTAGIVIGGTAGAIDSTKIELPSVRRTAVSWGSSPNTSQCGGVVLINIRFCTVFVGAIRHFTCGVQLWSEGQGLTYNNFYGGTFIDNRFQICLNNVGSASYTNQNSWFGAEITYSSVTTPTVSASAVGVYFTYGTAGYTGANNNQFYGVSFEMPTVTSHPSITEGVPVWFEGCGNYNRFHDCRAEGWNGPLMHVRGNVNSDANATVGLFNELDIGLIGTVGSGNGYQTTRQVAGAYGNKVIMPGRNNVYSWDSGPLRDTVWSGGPANGARCAAPYFFRSGTSATNLRQHTASQVRTNVNGLQHNGGGTFIMIDTSRCKDFEFFSATQSGNDGRWFFQALDASRTALSNTTTDAYATERNIKFPGATASSLYGGGMTTGTNAAVSVRVTVREEVKFLIVGRIFGNATCVVNSIGFHAYLRTQDSAAGNMDSFPLIIDPFYDAAGIHGRTASANPGTSGTHGFYSRGHVIENNAAASGVTSGWICTTAGMLGAARADATAYNVPGEVIISGSGAYRVKTAGTTGTGTAPAGAVVDTDYTDGTVVFTCIGAKAVFTALANIP